MAAVAAAAVADAVSFRAVKQTSHARLRHPLGGAGRLRLQMLQDPPEKLFGHGGGTFPVGMGKSVAAGGAGSAQGGKRPGMQLQGVAQVMESDAMAQLGVEEAHGMAPGIKGAGLILHPGGARYLGHFMRRNVVAKLAQNVELASCWSGIFVFHPCRVAGLQSQTNTFFRFSVGWL